jgi:foldase protein PrsA
LIGIVIVAVLAGLGIYSQFWMGTAATTKVALSREELDLFAEKNLGARERTQFSTDSEARKRFLERLGKQLSLAAEAQRRGLGDSDMVKAIEALGAAQILGDAYVKAHPDAAKGPQGPRPSDEEIQAFLSKRGDEIARYQAAIAEQAKGMPAPKPEDIAAAIVVAEKARAEGLDKSDKETELQLKLNHYGALIQALVPQIEKETTLDDQQFEAFYNEKSAAGELDQIHAQHILFATVPLPNPQNPMGAGEAPDPAQKEQQAREVLARIKNGEEFGELAKQFSDDFSTKEKGGDLGWAERYKFVPEFEDAAWKLQPGEVSDIVKSDYGFHIIKMIERKPPAEVTPETKERLKEAVSQKRFEEKIDEIASRNPVVMPDDFTVVAPPPQPMNGLPGMMNPHGGPPPGAEGGMPPEGAGEDE